MSSIVTDLRMAIDFLSKLHPEEYWHLVAIEPDGPIIAKSFSPLERDGAAAFIKQHSGVRNLYVQVNPLHENVRHRKAKKENVKVAVYTHVDIDNVGSLDNLAFPIAPTAIVATGNGVNVYWRYTQPVADLDRAERINKALVAQLGGDPAATDVSRILRVPGTVNIPTKAKRARGKATVQAQLLADLTDWTREYDPSAFAENAQGSLRPTRGRAEPEQDIPVKEIPADIPGRIRHVATHGDDPERPRTGPEPRYASRSEAVFAVACALARAGEDRRSIAGVLLNPIYGVSVSIREKPDPVAYALKQADRALAAHADSFPDG